MKEPKLWSHACGLNYKKNMERAFIVALSICILFFIISKRNKTQSPRKHNPSIISEFIVENIPVTRQGVPRKKPERPQVIIPVSDDVIPEDEIIEEADLIFQQGKEGPTGLPTGEGFSVEALPRPIAEVFPEYPIEDLENRVEGTVTLHLHVSASGIVKKVIVLKNSTGSPRCAAAAKTAAQKSRFIPAKQNGKNISMWITKKYTFSAPK